MSFEAVGKNDDLGMFLFVHGHPLQIGTKVRLVMNHEFKNEWPSSYLICGINYVPEKRGVDITICDLDGTNRTDDWSVDDFIWEANPLYLIAK